MLEFSQERIRTEAYSLLVFSAIAVVSYLLSPFLPFSWFEIYGVSVVSVALYLIYEEEFREEERYAIVLLYEELRYGRPE